MGNQNPFRCRFEVESGATKTVLNKDVKAIKAIAKHPDAVRAAVDMFFDQARALLEGSTRPEVIVVALPKPIIEKVVNASAFPEEELDEEDERDDGPTDLNFRDLFKARALALNVPTQIAWPTLWDDAAKISNKMKASDRRVAGSSDPRLEHLKRNVLQGRQSALASSASGRRLCYQLSRYWLLPRSRWASSMDEHCAVVR